MRSLLAQQRGLKGHARRHDQFYTNPQGMLMLPGLTIKTGAGSGAKTAAICW